MSGSVSMRPATDADWSRIWGIWHEVVAAGDTYTYEPGSTQDEARAMWMPSSPDETWVAERAGAVVGTYHLAPNQPGAGRHVANASYMVDAAVRGGGVGRAMVEHSIGRAAEAGYLAIQFNAVAATNVHAIALYHRLGFVTVGMIPGGFRHPTESYVDLVVMYRSVGS